MRLPTFRFKGRSKMSIDPVCHMEVPVRNPTGGKWEYNGVEYFFCGQGCNIAFQREADAYLSGAKKVDM